MSAHLELGELAAPSHEVESTAGTVNPAILAGTGLQRHERGLGNGLVGLHSAFVAGVGCHLQHGLHFGAPGHDTL